ncbi:PEP motif putative anchor domain protein [Gemmatirosa kalamazoonensis]|uniref:PEP motif putative anchor domain protein n=1 Tax=Gemmatirosa kalamazoonensis TaxID=861299 RepID=W0RBF8_9BACT|nr:PEP-CTERM sorting domain-containing protein [Gemmatirosa kalamazoonensis]AHG87650.1 PEP motif putative anchor domain protein [Gemmatirosa kalamazoonensis]
MHRSIAMLSLCAVGLAPLAAHAQVVRSGAGTLADVTAIRDAFRADLGGGTVAGANGSFGGIRREINWDAVPDAFSAPNNLPANFFNANSPRGAVFATAGTGFQLSANAGVAPIAFDNIDPSYSSTFQAFSPQRLFTALGSNVVDVNFFVAGTSTAALVRGFGAIFSDVDLANTTSIQFFGPGSVSLGTFYAPSLVGSQSFSFLGVSWATPIVSRVRITNGNAALGAGVLDQNGNPVDLVVMDDFLYGEPVDARSVVPEPATLALVGGGFLALVGGTHRRRRRMV